MKWICSASAGSVEGFSLFSEVLPARCVSSISPRFHYRRHTICFLPLAAILESCHINFFLRITACDCPCVKLFLLVL
jgi:hypothetical protein